MKKNRILVYGATGYTGKIICNRLKKLRLNYSIAGRNEDILMKLANELEVSYFTFETFESSKWKESFNDVVCLINAAGPFSSTSEDAIKACLENKVHYLDISAELQTYQLAESYNEDALNAGIMIMAGAGLFVTYDALVIHTAKRIIKPTSLAVAFRHYGGFSKGSIKSSKHIADLGTLIRKNGDLVIDKNPLPRIFNFGEGPEECFPTPLGGILISYHSTKIPEIREYFQLKLPAISLDLNNLESLPEGPSELERSSGRNKLSVEVSNDFGDKASSLADLPSGYDLTPLSVVAVAHRVINGDFKIGYQTPGLVYGEDILKDIPTTIVSDLDS